MQTYRVDRVNADGNRISNNNEITWDKNSFVRYINN